MKGSQEAEISAVHAVPVSADYCIADISRDFARIRSVAAGIGRQDNFGLLIIRGRR
jgi:hypothetical protein